MSIQDLDARVFARILPIVHDTGEGMTQMGTITARHCPPGVSTVCLPDVTTRSPRLSFSISAYCKKSWGGNGLGNDDMCNTGVLEWNLHITSTEQYLLYRNMFPLFDLTWWFPLLWSILPQQNPHWACSFKILLQTLEAATTQWYLSTIHSITSPSLQL